MSFGAFARMTGWKEVLSMSEFNIYLDAMTTIAKILVNGTVHQFAISSFIRA